MGTRPVDVTSDVRPAVRFDEVSKRFGKVVALDGFSLSIPDGGVFGLVGRNGAGKTTAMRMLLGLVAADSGSVELTHGLRIGYVPEAPTQYGWMTAREYLHLGARLASIPEPGRQERIAHLSQQVHLSDVDMRIREYGVGDRMKLAIAFAMIGQPDLLILDEPTSALDPSEEHDLLEIIASFRYETTVLFVSHVLRDVERIADSITIMDQGRMLAQGSMDELRLQTNLQPELRRIHPSLEDVFATLTEGES